MQSFRTYQYANAFAVIATIIMNSLVNILPVNGVTTGEVSDFYPNLFTPPGYVFAIWAVIYTLAVIFMVYQFRSSQRNKDYLGGIGFLYVISAALNIIWLFVFHYSYGAPSLFLVSVFIILALLGNLLLIYHRLSIGLKKVSFSEKFAVHLHFSVYLGWISLASIAAIASGLNIIFPNIPFGLQQFFTAFVVVIALLLVIFMVNLRKDFAYGLVVVWAAIGIALKNSGSPVIYYTCIITVIIIVLNLVVAPFIRGTSLGDFYTS
jgi:hypothetical protein